MSSGEPTRAPDVSLPAGMHLQPTTCIFTSDSSGCPSQGWASSSSLMLQRCYPVEQGQRAFQSQIVATCRAVSISRLCTVAFQPAASSTCQAFLQWPGLAFLCSLTLPFLLLKLPLPAKERIFELPFLLITIKQLLMYCSNLCRNCNFICSFKQMGKCSKTWAFIELNININTELNAALDY